MNGQRDFGWVVIPLALINSLLLFVIATKGPPEETTVWQQPAAPITVTVEQPRDCSTGTKLHQSLCRTHPQ